MAISNSLVKKCQGGKKALHVHSMSGSQAQGKEPEKENDPSFFQGGMAMWGENSVDLEQDREIKSRG